MKPKKINPKRVENFRHVNPESYLYSVEFEMRKRRRRPWITIFTN